MSSDAFASPFPGGAFQAILNTPIPDYVKLSGPLLAVITHMVQILCLNILEKSLLFLG